MIGQGQGPQSGPGVAETPERLRASGADDDRTAMAADRLAPDATRRPGDSQAEGPRMAIHDWPVSARSPGHPVVTTTAEDAGSRR